MSINEDIEKYENDKLIQFVKDTTDEILEEKNSNHHRDKFFPILINKLNLNCGVEIGVDKAEFSLHILEKTDMKKYYCIDTWQDNFGSDFKKDKYDPAGDKRLLQAYDNLKPYIDSDRVEIIRAKSIDAFQVDYPPIDYVYIDGDHSLFGIYNDLHAWTYKAEIGAIIAGHDYKDGPNSGIQDCFGEQLPYRIKTVVDDFCRKHGFYLHTIGGRILSWFFVKNKDFGKF